MQCDDDSHRDKFRQPVAAGEYTHVFKAENYQQANRGAGQNSAQVSNEFWRRFISREEQEWGKSRYLNSQSHNENSYD
jgi:hypothetical protein